MQEKIKIVGLRKKFDDKFITNGVDLIIPEGQMTVVIGRSGEGKSVLLKQLIGLIEPTEGEVIIDGVNLITAPEEEKLELLKKFGYVFQFAALLDSLNVFENICITLLENGVSQKDALPIAKEKLSLVHLEEDTLYKYPSQLSGGMKKRVGLARTLVTKPEVLLYDEPTTGLDPITSRAIHELMYHMQQTFRLTSVVISHDIEIFKYADNIALLHNGTIKYFGPAKTAFESDNPFLYQFIRGLQEGPIETEIEPYNKKEVNHD
jgi:phospholipid/cholesterol/gamma-HCH transport system ATP-binding protein